MVDTYLLLSQIIPATLSCLGSGLVVLTYLVFTDFRKLRYIELVFYISFNDLLGSIGLAIGGTDNYSVGCWYQGITTGLNFLSSVFWTVVITYQVWLVVHRGSVIKDLTYIHLICWGIPTIVTFLPLSTNTYGNNDDHPTWCFVANLHNSPSWGLLVWFLLGFYVWLWLALLVSCILLVSIFIRLRAMNIIPETVRSTLKKLVLYPIAIFVCWIFNTLTTLYFTSGGEHDSGWRTVADLGTTLASFQGLFFALIFFTMNPLVRFYWKLLLHEKIFSYFFTKKEEIEPTKSQDSWETHQTKVRAEIDYMPSYDYPSFNRQISNDSSGNGFDSNRCEYGNSMDSRGSFSFASRITAGLMSARSTMARSTVTDANIQMSSMVNVINPINSVLYGQNQDKKKSDISENKNQESA